jgi:hypothetical protein
MIIQGLSALTAYVDRDISSETTLGHTTKSIATTISKDEEIIAMLA